MNSLIDILLMARKHDVIKQLLKLNKKLLFTEINLNRLCE